MQNRLARADVPVELTWNLDDLFASAAHWEAELEALDAARAEVQPYQGRLGESAATLLACLDTVEMLQQRLMRVGMFAHLRNAQDGTNAAIPGRAGARRRPGGAAGGEHRLRRLRDPRNSRRHGGTLPGARRLPWRYTRCTCTTCWKPSRTG